MRLGELVRARRNELNMSIAELAEKTGVSQSFISRLERGDFKSSTVEMVLKLAEGLNVHVTYFFGEPDQNKWRDANACCESLGISPEMVKSFAQGYRYGKDEGRDNYEENGSCVSNVDNHEHDSNCR